MPLRDLTAVAGGLALAAAVLLYVASSSGRGTSGASNCRCAPRTGILQADDGPSAGDSDPDSNRR